MPYKDWADRHAMERRLPHRREHFAHLREATNWANAQIAILKSIGAVHTREEWREVRNDLRRYWRHGPRPREHGLEALRLAGQAGRD